MLNNALPEAAQRKAPKPIKPLGHKAYGSIPHLPGSRRGPADKGVSEQMANLFCSREDPRSHRVIVEVKLDGSCVSVANVDGQIIPLGRAGYPAISSPYPQHHMFHDWAMANKDRFDAVLLPGWRVVGEWLALAHGTRYDLPHEPFVAFDVMAEHERVRAPFRDEMLQAGDFVTPHVLHDGPPISVEEILPLLETPHHGETDLVEGAVWRCHHQTNRGKPVLSLAKYVRPEKIDGLYLVDEFWNWRPDQPED